MIEYAISMGRFNLIPVEQSEKLTFWQPLEKVCDGLIDGQFDGSLGFKCQI